MRRVFPTQLKVVHDVEDLNLQEEGNKGYFDASSSLGIEIGVRNKKIYVASPGNWYRHFIFVVQGSEENLWRVVANVVKTQCGRKVLYHEGDHFVTVPHMNHAQIKQMYYLIKHTLTNEGLQYKVSSSFFNPPYTKMIEPDIRVKPKRRRRKHE